MEYHKLCYLVVLNLNSVIDSEEKENQLQDLNAASTVAELALIVFTCIKCANQYQFQEV